MRIISQDGRADIPYENFVFGVTKDNYVVAIRDTIVRPSEVAHGIVAEYSTEEKAQKAIEMLHNDYYGHVAEKIYHEGAYYIHPYFRFPKDEDVEV